MASVHRSVSAYYVFDVRVSLKAGSRIILQLLSGFMVWTCTGAGVGSVAFEERLASFVDASIIDYRTVLRAVDPGFNDKANGVTQKAFPPSCCVLGLFSWTDSGCSVGRAAEVLNFAALTVAVQHGVVSLGFAVFPINCSAFKWARSVLSYWETWKRSLVFHSKSGGDGKTAFTYASIPSQLPGFSVGAWVVQHTFTSMTSRRSTCCHRFVAAKPSISSRTPRTYVSTRSCDYAFDGRCSHFSIKCFSVVGHY